MGGGGGGGIYVRGGVGWTGWEDDIDDGSIMLLLNISSILCTYKL